MEACCTCATLLSKVPRHSESEKPLPHDRRLACCTRVICGLCVHNNSRFASYCPYCQISTTPSTLPQGLKEPPSYAFATASVPPEAPPPYTPRSILLREDRPLDDEKAAAAAAAGGGEGDSPPAEDILHFLDHDHDTVSSLSLRYGVPPPVLRQVNKLPSDHLLLARRTVLIPGTWCRPGAVSLSPRPVEGEEEERRRSKIRRWMVGCKVADYDIAVLYLEQVDYDLGAAMEAYFADEAWEKAHPLHGRGGRLKGKGAMTARGTGNTAFSRRRI
ncbi:Thiamine biosynthetic bifunctional enzyme [Pleurostoma richardsiae]|uniref:Thiamine biosynthetic bifunctional enzyme n=1 Tax=Pleurostoma richardsiae TaxID=41990 RepID=A0AA38RZA3_9PEZI|nr:Thiamine biosynthetic bifunctional enzyme [Pleurostoma richardsiae]